MGQLSGLQSLWLLRTGLTGSIPSELGLLSPLLSSLNLNGNQLTGTVPTELSSLVGFSTGGGRGDLAFLDLKNNSLSGTFPATLCGVTAAPTGGSGDLFDCGINNMCGCDSCQCV